MGDQSEIVAGRPAKQKQLIHASQIAAHKTSSAPESPFSLCNVTDREGGVGVGLRMQSELEYLLYRSMWETYFSVHFQSRYGHLKPLQSFWYTLYVYIQGIILVTRRVHGSALHRYWCIVGREAHAIFCR
jgi:hypothetical protein